MACGFLEPDFHRFTGQPNKQAGNAGNALALHRSKCGIGRILRVEHCSPQSLIGHATTKSVVRGNQHVEKVSHGKSIPRMWGDSLVGVVRLRGAGDADDGFAYDLG